jgi:hypothetical protein
MNVESYCYFYKLINGTGDFLQILYTLDNSIQTYEQYYFFYTDTFESTNNKIIHYKNIKYRLSMDNILDTVLLECNTISNMLQHVVGMGFDVTTPQEYQELVELNEIFKNNNDDLQIQKNGHDIMSQELSDVRHMIDKSCNSDISCSKAHSILKNSRFFEKDCIQTRKTFNSVKCFQNNLRYLKHRMINKK